MLEASEPQEVTPAGRAASPGGVIHLLDDVQQAVEVVSVAALSQVHQQLSGQFSDLMVFVLWDVSQLGDHHQVYQLLLQEDRPS